MKYFVLESSGLQISVVATFNCLVKAEKYLESQHCDYCDYFITKLEM
mgnify:CR=1 FL=1